MSPFLETPNPAGQGPEQAVLADSARATGWSRCSPEVLSYTKESATQGQKGRSAFHRWTNQRGIPPVLPPSHRAVLCRPCDSARPFPDPHSSCSLPAFVSSKPAKETLLLLGPVHSGGGSSAPHVRGGPAAAVTSGDRRGGHRQLLHRPFHQRTSPADGACWSRPGRLRDAEREEPHRERPAAPHGWRVPPAAAPRRRRSPNDNSRQPLRRPRTRGARGAAGEGSADARGERAGGRRRLTAAPSARRAARAAPRTSAPARSHVGRRGERPGGRRTRRSRAWCPPPRLGPPPCGRPGLRPAPGSERGLRPGAEPAPRCSGCRWYVGPAAPLAASRCGGRRPGRAEGGAGASAASARCAAPPGPGCGLAPRIVGRPETFPGQPVFCRARLWQRGGRAGRLLSPPPLLHCVSCFFSDTQRLVSLLTALSFWSFNILPFSPES